jgi:copper homeostasis protein CutC
MQKPDDPSSRWVQTEAAKHTTLDSMRRRIADETEQIRILLGAGLTDESIRQALENHHELIRVLTKRLAKFR